jgi:DnaK suppressor protein
VAGKTKKTVKKTAGKAAVKADPRPPVRKQAKAEAGRKVPPKPARKPADRHAAPAAAEAAAPKVRLSAKEKEDWRKTLLAMRDRLCGQIAALKGESLTREDAVVTEEDGTDAFDRQFALSLASSENEAVFQIDEALRRIEEGRYGVCQECSSLIEKPRLKALPFVRTCVKCQSKLEKGSVGFRLPPSYRMEY